MAAECVGVAALKPAQPEDAGDNGIASGGVRSKNLTRHPAVSEDGPLGHALAQAVEEITGRPPRFEMCPGLLEIRFYAERGIPAFAYGPDLLTVSHGPNEFVPIARIVECAQVYALTAANLFLATDAHG